ncbi:hypothetical protein V6N11_017540 [Hibiscus sabdariffa]|uniref:RNase H type-1 domain-containing protein n=1 Tax=Hibiscus sabdariffa TaxID=183260 RepID=A0ABR2TYB7_9ROSI
MEASLEALNIADGEEEPLVVPENTLDLGEDYSLCLVEQLGQNLMYWGSVKRKQRKLTKTSLVSRLQVLEDCDPDEETNKTNKIDEIIDQNGNLVSSMEGVLQTASSYFAELFTASSMGDTASIYDNVKNNLIHEGTVCSVTKVSTFVLAYLRELDSLAALAIPAKLSKDVKWIPPVGDFFKLNFDASFDSALKASVSRIIARDSYGLILAACYSHHSGVADAFIAEAFACEKAVSLAIDLGFRSEQIEGDSLTIIKKLQSASVDKSVISPIINDIRVLMDSFEEITFSFVNRAGNAAAHELARVVCLDLFRFSTQASVHVFLHSAAHICFILLAAWSSVGFSV